MSFLWQIVQLDKLFSWTKMGQNCEVEKKIKNKTKLKKNWKVEKLDKHGKIDQNEKIDKIGPKFKNCLVRQN